MQEAQIEAILQEAEIDLLVLARYMQIFSADFCSRHAQHTINIHHSFLPAFEGAPKPVVSSCKDEGVSPLCCSCKQKRSCDSFGIPQLTQTLCGGREQVKRVIEPKMGTPSHLYALRQCLTASARAGAKPYHRAYERGVKVIGATAHYATGELDAGPIIEQDVARISHRDSVQDMIRKGRDLERLVLARALRAVLSDCVMVYDNRTVVFDP